MADEPASIIRAYYFIASYNDLGGSPKTILVPGCPPIWSPPDAESLRVSADEATVAPSAAALLPDISELSLESPKSDVFGALEPMIRATRTIWGGLAWASDYHLITNRTALSLLFQTVFGVQAESFKLACVEVGGCMFLAPYGFDSAMEARVRQPDTSMVKYRKSILRKATSPSMSAEKNSKHHRIIEYKLGRMRVLLEYQVDGHIMQFDYLTDTDTFQELDSEKTAVEAQLAAREAINLRWSTAGAPTTRSEAGMTVKKGGRLIPQGRVVDLVLGDKGECEEVEGKKLFGNLWLGHVTRLGESQLEQENGDGAVFSPPTVWHMRPAIEKWEKDNADKLRQYTRLLERIYLQAKRRVGICRLEYDASAGMLVMDDATDEEVGASTKDLVWRWERIRRGF